MDISFPERREEFSFPPRISIPLAWWAAAL
jgi:hypothetical protein